ncbi:carbon-nitrogen hydrolase family protein [Cellulomonas chengniuliangii]|uniref:carbon-nitrogen hydrolase family protein n=1 Tax=Cellulomonas chengniuliangii TaxID=2968084 RepID=UPI001D0DC45D|nr:carbon-nitrogen hydrolase family protein [Cellulomonas chengniuliangii]MCC2317008.1 carbon-nitrogen hydrolase family protein [Cellulomonas chengniuliangii]
MRPDLVLALAQTAPVPGDVPANAAHAVAMTAQAAASGARLVVFPELSLVGYDLSLLEDGDRWLSGVDDPRLDPLRDAARAEGVWLVVGVPVRPAGGGPVIASLVLAPDGRAHAHPKERLHGSETLLFTPGTPTPPFDVDGWLVALAVCFDMADPAHAAQAAAAGADLYVSSSVYVEGEERRLDLHHGARAMDHRMYAAMAGQVGPSGIGLTIGGAGVWRPDGVREATLGAEPGLLVRTLRSAELDRHRA